jgi:hypothetical protein
MTACEVRRFRMRLNGNVSHHPTRRAGRVGKCAKPTLLGIIKSVVRRNNKISRMFEPPSLAFSDQVSSDRDRLFAVVGTQRHTIVVTVQSGAPMVGR